MMAAAPRPPLLVATDFSPSANLAVDRAALLAAQHDWPLHLAHAIAPGFLDELQRLLTPQVPAISSSLVGKAMAELQTLANDPRHTHGLDTDCHVLLGKPVDALLQHASDLCSPLLVVGSRGETSLRHLTVGSTAARLLRKSRQPLLVVKGAATTPYQHALVGIDFSPSSLAALRLVRQLAPQAWLTLLHVLELPFEEKCVTPALTATSSSNTASRHKTRGCNSCANLPSASRFCRKTAPCLPCTATLPV